MRTKREQKELNDLHKSYSREIKKLDNKLNKKDQTIKRLRNKTAGVKALKKFPNGFTSWMETHHEVVKAIESAFFYWGEQSRDLPETIKNRMDIQGTGGMYELAEELTDRFELLNKGRDWDGEFYDELEEFLTNELN